VYSRALQHAPDSARVLVNATLTLLKLAQPTAAHEKATLAIGLQPRNAKAYHARHKAKDALGDFKVTAAGGQPTAPAGVGAVGEVALMARAEQSVSIIRDMVKLRRCERAQLSVSDVWTSAARLIAATGSISLSKLQLSSACSLTVMIRTAMCCTGLHC
jgi:hypothetical protein